MVQIYFVSVQQEMELESLVHDPDQYSSHCQNKVYEATVMSVNGDEETNCVEHVQKKRVKYMIIILGLFFEILYARTIASSGEPGGRNRDGGETSAAQERTGNPSESTFASQNIRTTPKTVAEFPDSGKNRQVTPIVNAVITMTRSDPS